MTTQTLVVGKNHFHLEQSGVASHHVVLCLHGLTGDYQSWEPQIPVLQQCYTTITMNRRFAYPHQNDLQANSTSSIANNADDVADLLRQLDAQYHHPTFHLLGHSGGAFASLILAMQAQHWKSDMPHVGSVILVEPPIFSMLGSLPTLFVRAPRAATNYVKVGATQFAQVDRLLRKGEVLAGTERFITAVEGAHPVHAAVMEASRRNASVLPLEFKLGDLPHVRPAELDQMALPVLLIGGAQTQRFMLTILKTLASHIPHNTHVVIPGAGHFVHWDQPEMFNESVLSFLEKVTQG